MGFFVNYSFKINYKNGLYAHFLLEAKVSTRLEQLQTLLAPVIESLGYQCWGVEFISQGKHSLLRVFIDHANGIGVEDCEKVSKQVSAILDVEDPIPYEYTLEVSSPGMDRPLFTLEQYEQYIGEQIKVKLRSAFEGRRNFNGSLQGIEDQQIVLRVDNQEYLLPIELIEKANIEPNFD